MKKYLFPLLFLLVLMPLNAQKVVKYITFYPIPYGSHETITVEKVGASAKEGRAYINARDESFTVVNGNFIYPNASYFKGNLSLHNANNNTVLGTSTGQIKSGNGADAPSIYGVTSLYDSSATMGTTINELK